MLTMLHKARRTPGAEILAAVADGTRRVALVADRVLSAPFHWADGRRVLGDLAVMDDHMLQDIGLSRGDLRDALSGPAFHDATGLLVARRAERRSAH